MMNSESLVLCVLVENEDLMIKEKRSKLGGVTGRSMVSLKVR